MITLPEAIRGIYGAWRLIHFDRGGAAYFDGGLEGFWKSFWAAALVFPGEIILRLLFVGAGTEGGEATAETGLTGLMTVFVIAYAIQWVGFALAMVYISDMLGRFENYLAYIAAHNWSSVIQIAIVLPAAALFAASGIGEPGWAAAIFFAAVIATWVYLGFIARAVLDITWAAAAFVVLTEIMLALVLSWFSESMLGRI